MEFISIALLGLFSVFGSVGTITEAIALHRLDNNFESVEELYLRTNNRPSHNIARGKLQKIRIAGKGLVLKPALRIDTLELETDEISIDLQKLNTENIEGLSKSLKKPLQGAFRLVLTEEDLLSSLQSETVRTNLQKNFNSLVAKRAGNPSISYQLTAPSIEFMEGNKLAIKLNLERNNRKDSSQLAITLHLGVKLVEGKKIVFVDPTGTINDRPMSKRLLQGFAKGISDRLNLGNIEQEGIFARILQLEITEDKIELVGFVKLETILTSVDSTKTINQYLSSCLNLGELYYAE